MLLVLKLWGWYSAKSKWIIYEINVWLARRGDDLRFLSVTFDRKTLFLVVCYIL